MASKGSSSSNAPVTLVSSDGAEFVIDHDAACVSNTIKHMLASEGGFAETERRRVTFPEIPAPVLEHVCQYFYYKLQYNNAGSKAIPDFKLPPELALELLKAANYLDA